MPKKIQRRRDERIAKGRDWRALLEEYAKESDRAQAILITNALDLWLSELLRAYFVDNEEVVDELLENERPLATFAARIKCAYCIGLLTESEYSDLNLIRKVRNRFAHDLQGLSFDDAEISGWCKQLKGIPTPMPDGIERLSDPRPGFSNCAIVIAQHLQAAIKKTEHRSVRFPGMWIQTEDRTNEDGTIRVQTMSYTR